MNRSASIVLAFGLIIVLGLIASSRPPDRPAPLVNDQERAKFEGIKQQVLNKNPELKAEDEALKSRAENTRQQKKNIDELDSETQRTLDEHDRKVMEEGIKIDPSIEGIYFRMQDGYQIGGTRELIAYDNEMPLFRVRWHFVWEASFLLTAGLGLVLLFRPPSYAGANLYLTLALLPALAAGPMAFTEGDWAYIWHLSGIYDGYSVPQLLLIFHRDFMMAYLSSAICLMLYAAILFRIYRRPRLS